MAFESFSEKALSLHPHKRVKYTTGLVLGVDEFRQAEFNQEQKKGRHCRGLHGYGVVSGLGVQVDDEPTKTVSVAPGFAIDIAGRDLCVTREQCGSLLNWVRQQDLGVGTHEAYVVLCYDECDTDEVPVLAGPCLSHDQRTVASRVLERFRLEFRTPEEAPRQLEEPAFRALTSLLLSLSLVPAGSTVDDLADLLASVRSLADETPTPLATPFQADSEMIRAALDTWIREVRPQVSYAGGPSEPYVAATNSKADQPCVVLARLSFDVDSTGSALVIPGAVSVDTSSAPLLVPSQLVQMLALMGPLGEPLAAPPLASSATTVERRNVVFASSMARLGAPAPTNRPVQGAVRLALASGASNLPRVVARLPLPSGLGSGSAPELRLAWQTNGALTPSNVEWDVSVATQAVGTTGPTAGDTATMVLASGGTNSSGELAVSASTGLSLGASTDALLVITLTPKFPDPGSGGTLDLYYLELVYSETLDSEGGP